MKKIYKLFSIILIGFIPQHLMADESVSGKEIIKKNGFASFVEPLLSTHWCQNGGENNLLPYLDVAHTRHATTGCGAVAMAQVMNYWKYPQKGNDRNYYHWNEIPELEQTLVSDFSKSKYDWSNMVNIYKGHDEVNEKQLKAVGHLFYDIGVALQLKFNYNNPGTQIEYISSALKLFFGYNPQMQLLRMINGAYTMEEWLTILYRELSAGRPVIIGGLYSGSRGTANHIYVADGYNEEGAVHLNLGKAIVADVFNGDAYYDLTKTGETYNQEMRMIIGISPYLIETPLTQVQVNEAGTLKEVLGGDMASRKICRLKVYGTINQTDIKWLKTLSKITTGQLSYLDLSEASVIGNKIPDHAFDECFTLQEVILPDGITEIGESAFYSCAGLYKIHLPQQLQVLKRNAFAECRYLRDISLPATLKTIDNNPFTNVKAKALIIDPNNESFIVYNGTIFNYNRTTLICMPTQQEGVYEIPNGVEKVGRDAFSGAFLIDEVIIPESVNKFNSFGFINAHDIYSYSPEPLFDAYFSNFTYSGTLHVPQGCKEAYCSSSSWEQFKYIIDDLPCSSTIDFVQNNKIGKKMFDLSGRQVKELKPGMPIIIIDSNGKRLSITK